VKPSDILAVQDDIARAIATTLGYRVEAAGRERALRFSPEALDRVLCRGRAHRGGPRNARSIPGQGAAGDGGLSRTQPRGLGAAAPRCDRISRSGRVQASARRAVLAAKTKSRPESRLFKSNAESSGRLGNGDVLELHAHVGEAASLLNPKRERAIPHASSPGRQARQTWGRAS
jgi:hypothetical protein